MHVPLRPLMAGLVAVLLLALGTGVAAASRSFSVVGGGRAILAISSSTLTFENGSGTNLIVDVTLHGSIHPTLPKVRGALIGIITSISTANCRSSTGLRCRFSGLPTWHLKLASFTGTLPRIASLLFEIEAAILEELEGRPNCLYRGVLFANSQATLGPSESRFERFLFLLSTIPLFRVEGEEFFRRCARSIQFVGGFNFAPIINIRLQ